MSIVCGWIERERGSGVGKAQGIDEDNARTCNRKKSKRVAGRGLGVRVGESLVCLSVCSTMRACVDVYVCVCVCMCVLLVGIYCATLG